MCGNRLAARIDPDFSNIDGRKMAAYSCPMCKYLHSSELMPAAEETGASL